MSERAIIHGYDQPKFARVPNEFTFDEEVTDAAARLYTALMTYAEWDDDIEDDVFPGYERLGEALGWSSTKLVRTMKVLVAAGWVHRQRRPGTSSRTFLCAYKGQRPTWTRRRYLGRKVPARGCEGQIELLPEAESGSPNKPNSVLKQETDTQTQEPPPAPAPPAAKGKGPTWSPEAQAIATAVVDRAKAEGRTLNATGWKAVAQVAQKLLDVGHKADAITAAIPAATVCTFNAVTVVLGSRDVADGGERRTPTAPPPARPEVCPACVGHPKWEPSDPDDEESPMVPCRACRPAEHERWTRRHAEPAPPAPEAPTLPPRRDVD